MCSSMSSVYSSLPLDENDVKCEAYWETWQLSGQNFLKYTQVHTMQKNVWLIDITSEAN